MTNKVGNRMRRKLVLLLSIIFHQISSVLLTSSIETANMKTYLLIFLTSYTIGFYYESNKIFKFLNNIASE